MSFARAAFAFAVCTPLTFAQASGSLSARVVSSVSSVGIEGVKVWLCPAAGTTPRCGETNFRATTDPAGTVRMALPQGEYVVIELQKSGFSQAFDGFAPVKVSGDTRVEFQLTPYASIRGRVFDPEGKPAQGVSVSFGFQQPKVTNASGEFLIENVPRGLYPTLSATPKTQEAPSSDGTWTVTTYYPSVVDPSLASGIEVKGRDLSFDLRLQRAWAQPIRGKVLDAAGNGSPETRIEIVATKTGPVSFVRGLPNNPPQQAQGARVITTSKDGSFVSPPVREGEWALNASRLVDRELHAGSGSVTISSRSESIPSVELRLTPPVAIEVTADWGDSPPNTVLRDFALASFTSVDSFTSSELARRPISEPGAPQRFRVTKGRYFIWEGRTIGWGAQPGYYAAAAMWNGRDVLGQVVELTGPASLKIVYKNDGGTLRGTVEKGGDALVVLMADALPSGARVGYSGRCDADGMFSIPDVPPGLYTAVAVQGFSVDPLRPDFASALTRDGKRVRIEARGTTSVDLRRGL